MKKLKLLKVQMNDGVRRGKPKMYIKDEDKKKIYKRMRDRMKAQHIDMRTKEIVVETKKKFEARARGKNDKKK